MIEKAIHEVLNDGTNANALALLALLPVARIVTGTNHGRDLPYCSVNLESNGTEYRANADAAMRRNLVRFSVWHETHASGVAIREAIETLFENKAFETTEANLITRHENSLAIEEKDGVWQFLIDIEVKLTAKV